jgi:hypothetical protein
MPLAEAGVAGQYAQYCLEHGRTCLHSRLINTGIQSGMAVSTLREPAAANNNTAAARNMLLVCAKWAQNGRKRSGANGRLVGISGGKGKGKAALFSGWRQRCSQGGGRASFWGRGGCVSSLVEYRCMGSTVRKLSNSSPRS